MSVILEVSGLSLEVVKNPPQRLVNNVSFSLERSKVLGIVGESGSGKSLTALSILQLLPDNIRIASGKIIYSDMDREIDLSSPDIKNIRNYRGKSISMIFQEPMTSLNPSMKCGKQVEEAILAHKKMKSSEVKSRVLSLMKEVNLPRPEILYNSYPHQLSGGQRQRLMIAIALSSNPEILIADEPTTALDVTVQKNIITLLKNLKESRSLAIVFISHDLRLIREIADKVLVMRNGEIMEYSDAQKLFTNPESSYTKGLIACQPPLIGKPARLLTIRDFENKSSEPPLEKSESVIDYSKDPLLRVENLSVSYNVPSGLLSSKREKFKAVVGVNLEIFQGETLGLVGESGCGKTTLGKTILRLINNTEGGVFFRGVNISLLRGKDLKEFRNSVQVVFQDPYSSLNPRQTVNDMMNEVLALHKPSLSRKSRRLRIVELLKNVGLSENDLSKYPHQFSGGQRQRISIARSLAPEPVLLVLDESVSALDVSVQAQVLNLLSELKNKFNLSYLFISHDLSVVRYMSDRIIVMRAGLIEESGDTEKIFRNSEKEYTRSLISAIPGYQYSISSTS